LPFSRNTEPSGLRSSVGGEYGVPPVAEVEDGIGAFREVDAIGAGGQTHFEDPVRDVVPRAAVVKREDAVFLHDTGRKEVGVIKGPRIAEANDRIFGIADPVLVEQIHRVGLSSDTNCGDGRDYLACHGRPLGLTVRYTPWTVPGKRHCAASS
jgi:hypothetical protein